ncbi:MAG: exopolyphosphatase [Treponema sp.]|nr:exopolyphosphatase [Treponema sp.]
MRLLTRSDFDGLACGALLEYLGIVDEYKFVHPKDIQDGLIEAGPNDILANIPYVKGCKLWFDHHYSESERLGPEVYFEGVSKFAPSCARVIYDYYDGENKLSRFDEMLKYVDKVDSGDLTIEEIRHPAGWILLGFIMDPRTGLGRFRDFSISNYELMEILAKTCVDKPIDEILAMNDVKERIEVYQQQSEAFEKMIKKHARTEGNAIVLDLRGVEMINAGNRFMIYSIFPDQNISIWIIDGKNKQNVAITVGYSIFNRTATINVGKLLLSYGGGGHTQVGTCQADYADADRVIGEILEAVK